jgi:hypothetical protein
VFENSDLIHAYSREEAIADGVLIDVSETAKEAGFRYPVALTRAVRETCVAVPPGVACQDETGRLWDLLWMAAGAVCRAPANTDTVSFAVHVRNDNRDGIPPLVRLKAICGPGDCGEPVLTALNPEED